MVLLDLALFDMAEKNQVTVWGRLMGKEKQPQALLQCGSTNS
jgi:hypothetical protein